MPRGVEVECRRWHLVRENRCWIAPQSERKLDYMGSHPGGVYWDGRRGRTKAPRWLASGKDQAGRRAMTAEGSLTPDRGRNIPRSAPVWRLPKPTLSGTPNFDGKPVGWMKNRRRSSQDLRLRNGSFGRTVGRGGQWNAGMVVITLRVMPGRLLITRSVMTTLKSSPPTVGPDGPTAVSAHLQDRTSFTLRHFGAFPNPTVLETR